MAYATKIFYGFKASNNLSDVIDKKLALVRLNLNIGDLDIIRGAASELGASREDLIAISDLNRDIYKTLDRYIGDSSRYKDILDKSAGTDSSLLGNLNVNGAIGGSAIKYKFLDTATETIRIADISTSRTSAWSTIANPTIESSPIFYGAQLKIVSNGSGVGGTISVDKLTWGEVAQPKLFPSEIPTHKITTTINGNTVKLYAMKSIPLKLEGFFRNFNSVVSFTPVESLRVSWRIVNLTNSLDEQRYQNLGTTTSSTLSYRSVSSASRRIEIYYPPDNINSITLTSIGLSKLPAANLPNLTELNVALNEIKQMPNLNAFCPNLTTLNIFRNNLHFAEDASLRKLNIGVVSLMPSSITSLNMHSTYYGSIRQVNTLGTEVTPNVSGARSVIEYRFPNLVTLNIQKGAETTGPYFSPDEYDPNSYLPSVPVSCQNYFAGSNDFRNIPTTGLKNRTGLKNVTLESNINLRDNTFSLDSMQLENVSIGSTYLPIPNLRGRPSLKTFNYQYGGDPNISSDINSLYTNSADESTYKFNSCTGLTALNLFSARAVGPLPKFKNNQNLDFIDFYAAQGITGGRPVGGEHGYNYTVFKDQPYVMYRDTFADARNVSLFRVLSYSLLEGKGFEEGTFSNLRNLYYLLWFSYGRTGAGGGITLPDISSCPSLTYFIMPANAFAGSVPSFVSNNNIFYVDLSYNNLSGPVPSFTNRLNLAYLFLHNNLLTSFPGFANTPNLNFVYLQNNKIVGKIPNLSNDATNINRLYLFNNQFNNYEPGSFSKLTKVQEIDISNNKLQSLYLDNIIDDLFANYVLAPRRGVNINIRSQTNDQGNIINYNPSPTGSQREKDVREKITFLQNNGWVINF